MPITNLANQIILPGDSGERLQRGGKIVALTPSNIWSRDRERQIRDIGTVRAIVERRRRRTGFNPPLCSTTFGGSTIPPLFGGGGGGFLQGDIRIGSVGADYIGPLGGNPAPVILPAASANVGDELWQAALSSGTYTNPAGWTQVVGGATVLFNRYRIFRRTATGTAADDFILPLNTLMVIAKQWSLQEVLPFDTFPSSIVQGGFLNDASTLTWDVGFPPGTAMSAVAGGDPSKWVLGNFACQDRQQPGGSTPPTISDSNPDGLETIASFGAFLPTGGASVDTLIMLQKFQYLPVSVAYVAYAIGRTPGAPNTYSQWTQYSRLQIF